MTTTVVLLNNVRGENGQPWKAGDTKTCSDAWAEFLIGRGDAYDASGVRKDVSPVSGAGVAAPTNLKAAIDTYKMDLRTRPPILFGVFDSNGAAQGGGESNGASHVFINAWKNGPLQQVKDFLPTLNGLRVTNTAWCGDGNMSVNGGFTLNAYDPRVTLSAGATLVGSPSYIGGRWVQLAPGASITINFGQRIDTAEIGTIQRSVATNFSTDMQIRASDGTVVGASYTQQTGGADAISMETRTSAKFNDGIVTVYNNDGTRTGHVFFVIGYPTNEKVAVLMHGAWAAARVADFAASANVFNGVNFHSVIQPDLTILALIINNTNDATAPATYNASLVTILDKLKLYGDLVIATSCLCGFARYTDGTYAGLRAELRKLAVTYSAKFVAIDSLFGSYAAANAAGYMFDDRHGTKANYALQAKDGFAPVIRSLL